MLLFGSERITPDVIDHAIWNKQIFQTEVQLLTNDYVPCVEVLLMSDRQNSRHSWGRWGAPWYDGRVTLLPVSYFSALATFHKWWLLPCFLKKWVMGPGYWTARRMSKESFLDSWPLLTHFNSCNRWIWSQAGTERVTKCLQMTAIGPMGVLHWKVAISNSATTASLHIWHWSNLEGWSVLLLVPPKVVYINLTRRRSRARSFLTASHSRPKGFNDAVTPFFFFCTDALFVSFLFIFLLLRLTWHAAPWGPLFPVGCGERRPSSETNGLLFFTCLCALFMLTLGAEDVEL